MVKIVYQYNLNKFIYFVLIYMACFWNGTLAALNKDHIILALQYKNNRKPSPSEFVALLQKHVIKTTDVLWNGQILKDQLLIENLNWIKTLNINLINNGHDCSICNPFLLLICQLFKINIIHDYNGTIVNYTHRTLENGNIFVLRFKSNKGHFWKI
jgi:hypothetical protein